jgi:hypothetical protein
VLTPNAMPLADQILNCEAQYHQKNLPCIFRLLSFNNNAGADFRGMIVFRTMPGTGRNQEERSISGLEYF